MYISPCIGVCTIEPHTQVCTGCGRSTLEIRSWKEYSQEQKLKVMQRLGYGVRKGGRKERINK